MKVVLISDVKKIGRRGEIKEVADGYAHNFLMPQKKALAADSLEAKKFLDSIKSQHDRVSADEKAIMKVFADNQIVLSIQAKGNEKGHLYKAVGSKEIAAAFTKLHQNIPSIAEHIEDCSFKELGDHGCILKIAGKRIPFQVLVEAQ